MKPNTGGSTRTVIATTLGKMPSTLGTTKKVMPAKSGKKPATTSKKMATYEKGKADMKMDRTMGLKEGSKKDNAIDLKKSQDYSYKPVVKRVVAKGISKLK